MLTGSPQGLANRIAQLRREVARHKAAIRQHRDDLQTAAAALSDLTAECARRGIDLLIVSPTGEGVVHGHVESATEPAHRT